MEEGSFNNQLDSTQCELYWILETPVDNLRNPSTEAMMLKYRRAEIILVAPASELFFYAQENNWNCCFLAFLSCKLRFYLVFNFLFVDKYFDYALTLILTFLGDLLSHARLYSIWQADLGCGP